MNSNPQKVLALKLVKHHSLYRIHLDMERTGWTSHALHQTEYDKAYHSITKDNEWEGMKIAGWRRDNSKLCTMVLTAQIERE